MEYDICKSLWMCCDGEKHIDIWDIIFEEEGVVDDGSPEENNDLFEYGEDEDQMTSEQVLLAFFILFIAMSYFLILKRNKKK